MRRLGYSRILAPYPYGLFIPLTSLPCTLLRHINPDSTWLVDSWLQYHHAAPDALDLTCDVTRGHLTCAFSPLPSPRHRNVTRHAQIHGTSSI